VYAVEIGNLAFEQGDWANARTNYVLAAQLGTYNPLVYRNLAFADRNLGLSSEARAAALAAYEMNPHDPVNQAVLAQFGGPVP
jgi:tetratricopeptide (TPR) repeat protein